MIGRSGVGVRVIRRWSTGTGVASSKSVHLFTNSAPTFFCTLSAPPVPVSGLLAVGVSPAVPSRPRASGGHSRGCTGFQRQGLARCARPGQVWRVFRVGFQTLGQVGVGRLTGPRITVFLSQTYPSPTQSPIPTWSAKQSPCVTRCYARA